MELVELNVFVWILYYSWDHYIGDEDKEMKKNVLPKFDCFSDPATIGPRWGSFENEDRSTKHPDLENEAPKSRKRSTQNSKRSTQNSKTKTPNLENEAPKTRKGSTQKLENEDP